MRKTLVILFAVAVLGILATYVGPGVKQDKKAPAQSAATQSSVSSEATAEPSPQSSLSASASTDAATVAASPSVSSPYKDGTYTGVTASNRYGDLKVSLSIAGGKITAVNLDTLTNFEEHSDEIDAYAIPRLKQQTISAQSADISGVSGATFTSTSYIKSLQSALDKARSS